MKKAIVILAAALLLAACADAPGDVVSRSEGSERSDSAEYTESAEVSEPAPGGEQVTERISPSELKAADAAAAERIKGRKYDNLKFADTFSVNAADAPELGVYAAAKRTDLSDNAEAVARAYFGEGLDASKLVRSSQPDDPVKAVCEQDGVKLIVSDSSLFIQDLSAENAGRVYSNDDRAEQVYEVTDAFADSPLAFESGEDTVKSLADMNAGFIDGLAALGYEYRPFAAASLTSEARGTKNTVVMTYSSCFKGIPVFNLAYNTKNGEAPDFRYSLVESNAAVFDAPGRLCSLLLTSTYEETEKLSAAESIISPDYAVEAASRELAEYLDLTARRLDLTYLPVFPEGAPEGDNSRVTMTPCWLLSFDLQPLREHYALIDAQTGRVTYFQP